MVQKFSKDAGLLHMIEQNLFGAFSMQKNERDRDSKKRKQKNNNRI